MRPEIIHAMAKAASSAPPPRKAPQRSRELSAAKATSIGSPTDTSQGTWWAVDEPVMRPTPSLQTSTSLASLAASCLATGSDAERSRPIQSGPFSLCATTMPRSLTIRTTLPGGSPCIRNAFWNSLSRVPMAITPRNCPLRPSTG